MGEYTRKLKMKCDQVISFGDGKDEIKALYEYSKDFDFPCIHFEFVRHPTIKQLHGQWKYIQNKFDKLMNAEFDQRANFHQYRICKSFEADNNPYFSGYKQLKAICDSLQFYQNN